MRPAGLGGCGSDGPAVGIFRVQDPSSVGRALLRMPFVGGDDFASEFES